MATAPAPVVSVEDPIYWHALPESDICERLGTTPDRGLEPEEAARRLEVYGYNELVAAPRPTFLQRLLAQFNDFIVIILIVAAVISALLGDHVEAIAIIAIVILNAVLGLVQEGRAEAALEALQQLAAPLAQVIRGGHRASIPARELVPGDIVVLEAGNNIPADLRLVETANLRIEEAALTGESHGVEKDASLVMRQDASLGDRRNSAFMGTVVSYGRGLGVVSSVGMHTQIGMIATMLQGIGQEETPLQRRLAQLGKWLGLGALVVCALVFLVGLLRGYDAIEMFLVAVSLAVAAVPEGLPAVVTITLALGMREMISRHALIRRLSSVETLGSTTVICSDKTGTLTQNVMTVTRLWVDGHTIEVAEGGAAWHSLGGNAFWHEDRPVDLKAWPATTTALWAAALANDAVMEPSEDAPGGYRFVGDPTETALLVATAKAGWTRAQLEAEFPRIAEVPFDSSRKRMTTVHSIQAINGDSPGPFQDESHRGWEVAVSKGAPDVLLELCTHYQTIDDRSAALTPEVRQSILSANEALAGQALRVLGLAYRVQPGQLSKAEGPEIESDLTFVGLAGMIDPPRKEVALAHRTALSAGIRTVMITGDYANTARAIAQEIGLIGEDGGVRSGAELEVMSDDDLAVEVRTTQVYARVSPEHKMRIVGALQRNGEIVAMTGDGVNDAPALKKADIGVAMGIAGTDVAKEAADMVLTDDNYASIVAAVEQGRVIYANIRKFVGFLLSCNMGEILVIFLAVLAGLPSPLTPIQLLWLNLISDGAPALALGVEKGETDTMQRPPRPPREPIINRQMILMIGVQTVAITAAVLGAYLIGLRHHNEIPMMADTMAFVTLSFSELLRAISARSERLTVFQLGWTTNRTMLIAVAASLVLLMLVVYVPFLQPIFDTVPLGWAQWSIVAPLLLVPTIAAELTKVLVQRFEPARTRPWRGAGDTAV
ncbi:MAG: cation-translocating P-type ATPase [Anaerolineae bacterium]